MSKPSKETEARLHHQLVKLGDMMGDGLHHEPDGKWINKEYRQTLKALGMLPKTKKANNSEAINARMIERVNDVPCGKCQSKLKQTRSGSKRAICISCGGKWQLLK
jgi:hypothetical protein